MSLIKVSAAKREANQRNAQKSSGPKTVEGKQRSSRNAATDGCTAAHLERPLRHESPDHHATILTGLIESWQPANAMESMLDLGAVIPVTDEKGLVMWPNVQRHSTNAWRDWHKAVETVRKLQNKRMAEAKSLADSTDMGSICISGNKAASPAAAAACTIFDTEKGTEEPPPVTPAAPKDQQASEAEALIRTAPASPAATPVLRPNMIGHLEQEANALRPIEFLLQAANLIGFESGKLSG